ncbi:hypothetical protein SGCOL_010429 [Colletotrichum sp. CLE4]
MKKESRSCLWSSNLLVTVDELADVELGEVLLLLELVEDVGVEVNDEDETVPELVEVVDWLFEELERVVDEEVEVVKVSVLLVPETVELLVSVEVKEVEEVDVLLVSEEVDEVDEVDEEDELEDVDELEEVVATIVPKPYTSNTAPLATMPPQKVVGSPGHWNVQLLSLGGAA